MDYRTLATRIVEDWKRRCRTSAGSSRPAAVVEPVASESASSGVGAVAGAVAHGG
jgi:hypothetical protein